MIAVKIIESGPNKFVSNIICSSSKFSTRTFHQSGYVFFTCSFYSIPTSCSFCLWFCIRRIFKENKSKFFTIFFTSCSICFDNFLQVFIERFFKSITMNKQSFFICFHIFRKNSKHSTRIKTMKSRTF